MVRCTGHHRWKAGVSGGIKFVSSPAPGSTFRFRLTFPVAEHVAAPEHNDQAFYAILLARIAGCGRRLRVLIVDDNPSIRHANRHRLRRR
jgi:hypothetical protein